ncbi:ankyrin repeat domain-containing protein [Treponema sp. OMZ 840]|uniref:ankyrin repeat domain-containing protein n=1 Tax=Treponema sp. OMZ 840 TaxID=244313 RepID=UPI003D8A5D64
MTKRIHGLFMCLAGSVFCTVFLNSCLTIPDNTGEQKKQMNIQELILAGKTEEVRALFQSQADINITDENGNTALHIAAQVNDAQLVTFLLYKGADSEIKNYAGDTALHVAVKHKAAASAEVLAALNSNIFAKDGEGNTAFDIGLKYGSLFYDALLTTRTGEIRDVQGQTIIHYLVKSKNTDALKFCIKKGIPLSVKDIHGISPLLLAYSQKDLESVYIAALLILANAAPERGNLAYFEDAVKTHNLSMRFNDGQSPLHFAVISGETAIVQYLIKEGSSTAAKDISGSTPLHEAVRYGKTEIAAMLLDAGADINARDSMGKTPLLIISPDKKRQEIYQLLLQRGAAANAVDAYGDNALHIATMTKTETAVLEALVERGAVIDSRNKKGLTPLAQAVERKNAAHIAFFASKNADIHAEDINGQTPLSRSLEGEFDMIKTLINGTNINSRDSIGNTPLHIAVFKKASPEQTRFLLENGAEINARNRNGDSPLYMAVQQNNRFIGEMLLAQGADVFSANTANYSPLRLALSAGGDVQDWLLTSEVIKATDGMGNTPLHYAAEWHLNDAASVILEKGAPINKQNTNGETAVFSAVKSDNDSLIKIFIKNGADLNLRDYLGNTPLHACVRWEAQKAALMLLKSADVNAKNLSGKTALHEAAHGGRIKTAKLLLNHKADINSSDITGRTPLMDAVVNENTEMTALLLQLGASPSIQEMYGRTAYHDAAETGNTALIRLLRRSGGNPLARDIHGRTPLSLVLHKDKSVIGAVLGDDINLADSDGNTPAHIAVTSSVSAAMFTALIEAGFPVDRRNREGITPLLLAVKHDKPDLARIALEKGADPFIRDNLSECAVSYALKHDNTILNMIVQIAGTKRDIAGENILHYAAREADAATVQRLLSMSLDKTVKNISGETPYDTAVRWKRNDIAALLK